MGGRWDNCSCGRICDLHWRIWGGGRVSSHVCELAGFVFLLTCFFGFMCRSKRMRSHLHDVLCMPAFSCSRVATSGGFFFVGDFN